MAQITVNFSSYEDMVEFAKNLLHSGEKASGVKTDPAQVEPAASVSVPVQTVPTVPVSSASTPVTPVPTAPVQSAVPIQQIAPTQSASAVPTSQHTYTLDELATAAMPLMDAGMQQQLQQLISSFGVDALPALPPEQYGNFATALRGMGANI